MKVFLAGLLTGLFIGGIVTFIIYACIIIGKETDERLDEFEIKNLKCK